jgi:hypothetical protein
MFSSRIRNYVGAAACMLSPLFTAGAQNHKPVYQAFEVPGSIATYPLSINARMTITGYYVSKDGVTHGFVREEDGTISRFDVAGSSSTRPDSINFAGEITGTYITGPTSPNPGAPQGFVRSPEGKITLFGSTFTENGSTRNFPANPAQINVAGEVVGNFSYPLVAPGVFVRSRTGVVQVFTLSFGASYPTVATGLNASGAVVGYTSSESVDDAQGFLWSGQGPVPSPISPDFTTISAAGSTGTFPTAINGEGAVVGCYSINTNAGVLFAPLALTYYDFLYEPDGTITTLNVPGTVPSCLYAGNALLGIFNVVPRTISINREGTIVGSYTNAANVPVGFLQKKDGTLTTFTHPNATMTMPTAINNRDVVIGYFAHGTEIKGFIRLPEDCDK